MNLRRRWDINTRTQLISLGPALLLTLLLISFFTFVRIQDCVRKSPTPAS